MARKDVCSGSSPWKGPDKERQATFALLRLDMNLDIRAISNPIAALEEINRILNSEEPDVIRALRAKGFQFGKSDESSAWMGRNAI